MAVWYCLLTDKNDREGKREKLKKGTSPENKFTAKHLVLIIHYRNKQKKTK